MTESRQHAWATVLTRRSAIGAAGAAAASVAVAPLARAQEATPVSATPVAGTAGDKLFFMFVQTAQAGSFMPKDGEEGVYQVTLEGADAQTIYFSDRPDRIVGNLPTDQFLDGLGFSPENPPNAAIVAQTDAGEDILVVELLNPVWDGAARTLTYDVRVLADYQDDGLGHLAEQQEGAELPTSFGHTSLFIDDCPNATSCYNGVQYLGAIPGQPYGRCWGGSGSPFCGLCPGEPTRRELVQLCRETYSRCGNLCTIQ